jgi:uncharacterized protein
MRTDRRSRTASRAWLGVNIEEHEGVNTRPAPHQVEQTVAFWAELARAWREHPVLRVRELDRALGFAYRVLHEPASTTTAAPVRLDPLPTVGWNGQVTLLSPELAGFSSPRHGSFACGSVLREPLDALIARGMTASWVREYRDGLCHCQDSCPYFAFCGGGHPANRHFEHDGRLDGTETAYCRNSKISLMEEVIRVAHHQPPEPG